MFVSKKTAALREELAKLGEECRQLRERLARYEAVERARLERERGLDEQFGKMMAYAGGLGGKAEGGA